MHITWTLYETYTCLIVLGCVFFFFTFCPWDHLGITWKSHKCHNLVMCTSHESHMHVTCLSDVLHMNTMWMSHSCHMPITLLSCAGLTSYRIISTGHQGLNFPGIGWGVVSLAMCTYNAMLDGIQIGFRCSRSIIFFTLFTMLAKFRFPACTISVKRNNGRICNIQFTQVLHMDLLGSPKRRTRNRSQFVSKTRKKCALFTFLLL